MSDSRTEVQARWLVFWGFVALGFLAGVTACERRDPPTGAERTCADSVYKADC